MARTRPTAADVARRSGVSTATVSYVLNRTTGQTISPETRAKVLRAADDLGYVQHAAAQALARGASRIVLIDRSGIPRGDLAEGAAGRLSAVVRRHGYTPLLTPYGPGGETQTLIDLARAIAPHAVITVAPLDAGERAELSAAGVQAFGTLFAGAPPLRDLIAGAAAAQVEFLAAQGHRGVLYVPATEPALADLAAHRGAAVAAAAGRLGLAHRALNPGAIDGPLDRLADALSGALADAMGDAVLTSIAGYNDEVAMRVLAALRRRDLCVPERVAVIGVDDLPLAELTQPALTTVRYLLDDPGPAGDELGWLTSPAAEPEEPPTTQSRPPTVHYRIVQRQSA